MRRLLRDLWEGIRPYFIKFIEDLAITCFLWTMLFVFKSLAKSLVIEGWAGQLIIAIHSAGVVAAFVVFAVLFIADVWKLKK